MNNEAYIAGYMHKESGFGDRLYESLKEKFSPWNVAKTVVTEGPGWAVSKGVEGLVGRTRRDQGREWRDELARTAEETGRLYKREYEDIIDAAAERVREQTNKSYDLADRRSRELVDASLNRARDKVQEIVDKTNSDLDIQGQINRGITSAGQDTWNQIKPYAYAAGGVAIGLPLVLTIMTVIERKKIQNRLKAMEALQKKELELQKKELALASGEADEEKKKKEALAKMAERAKK